MSIFVKICGMTDVAAIDAAVAANVDALGFVFHSASPRNLSPPQAARLAAAVPNSILKVAVTMHPEQSLCTEALQAINADVLQTDAEDLAYLSVPENVQHWPVIRENALPSRWPSRFVYEASVSGQRQRVDWQKAAGFSEMGEMILAGGLDSANIAEAITVVRPWGVDVSSAVEAAPGKKDPALVREFVTRAKQSKGATVNG